MKQSWYRVAFPIFLLVVAVSTYVVAGTVTPQPLDSSPGPVAKATFSMF